MAPTLPLGCRQEPPTSSTTSCPLTGAVIDPATSRPSWTWRPKPVPRTGSWCTAACVDPNYCVVCHTDQRKCGNAEATTTATGFSWFHLQDQRPGRGQSSPPSSTQHHMGEGLQKDGYNYANVLFNEVTYPQDQRNCVSATTAPCPQGYWKRTCPTARPACLPRQGGLRHRHQPRHHPTVAPSSTTISAAPATPERHRPLPPRSWPQREQQVPVHPDRQRLKP